MNEVVLGFRGFFDNWFPEVILKSENFFTDNKYNFHTDMGFLLITPAYT